MNKLLPGILIFLSACLSLYAQPSDYELEEIEFHGNESVSSSELSGAIASTESPNWLFKFLNSISESIGKPTVYFDSLKIQPDIVSLLNFYRDQGFFKTSISASFELDDDDKEASIRFDIVEGPRFIINNSVIRGLNDIPAEFVNRINSQNTIDSGKYYSKSLVEENTGKISTYLLNHGYMLVDPKRPVIVVDTVQHIVNVSVGFDPGRRYTIREIIVEKTGESKDNIRDTLLKQLVGVKPGQYYSAETLNRGQIRLYRTNLFTSVLVNTVIADTQGTTVPLKIKADVGDLNELVPEVIVNNQESTLNLGLGASYTRKNFLGDARNFSLSSNFTAQDVFNLDYSKIGNILAVSDTSILGYFDGRLTIEQPYFFGKPIRTRLESFFTINKQKEYRSTIYGGRFSLDFELPARVYFRSLLVYYSIEQAKYRIVPDYLKALLRRRRDIPVDTLNLENIQFDRPSSILGVETGINKTDDLLFPTRGYNLSLNFEEANSVPYLMDKVLGTNLKPKAQFYRFMAGVNYFPKLYASDENAFGLKLKLGYIKAFNGPDREIPLNKRFTAGGSNSIRGWRARDLSPDPDIQSLSVENLLDLTEQNITIGGTFLVEGSVETRNRLFGPVGGALFIDYGNVWNGAKSFRFDQIAVAAGFGFRFYSSFAPIRLDFGFKAYNPENRQTILDAATGYQGLKEVFKDMEFHIGIGEAF